eukprot:m.468490 g.468490  ORF g.468490 m.468490 type:complete len:1322 (+) comp27536_c0_seq1:111-4076(+)
MASRKRPATTGGEPSGKAKRGKTDPPGAKQTAAKRELRTEHFDRYPDGSPQLTVALTGAHAGQVLAGVVRATGENSSEGVLVQVVSGTVKANSTVCRPLDDDVLAKAYTREYGISTAVAMQQIHAREMTKPELDNAHPMGSGCPHAKGKHHVYGDADGVTCECPCNATFVILQPGAWADIADEFGNRETLMRYVTEATELRWRQILQLFGNKTLMFRARLFAVTSGPLIVAEPAEHAFPCALAPDGAVTYDVGGEEAQQVTVDPSAGAAPPNTLEEVGRLVQLAWPGTADDTIRRVHNALKSLTPGALKSVMQKAARFSAAAVELWDGSRVDTAEYAAVACCMLLLHPGGFVPQIQTMVRGVVAGLKRVVVICVEDAYPPGDGVAETLRTLFGSALVAQRVRTYQPPEAVYIRCIQTLCHAVSSPQIINWRRDVDPKDSGGRLIAREIPLTLDGALALQSLPKLLRELRSFSGDIDMMVTVAKLGRRAFKGDGTKCLPGVALVAARPEAMPECHAIDQHTTPGVAHAMPFPAETRGAARDFGTFAGRFSRTFNNVTGVNPRLHGLVLGFEDRPVTRAVRFAQRVTLSALRSQLEQRVTLVPNAAEAEFQLPIDFGTLAAGVGPVATAVKLPNRKRLQLLVMLPTVGDEGAEEVVMLQPTRGNVDDYLEWGDKSDPTELAQSDLERQAARRQVRSKRLVVKSPLLPSGHAEHLDGVWCLNRVPWTQWVAEGVPVVVETYPSPEWVEEISPEILQNDDVISEAVRHIGSGVCVGAREAVLALCDALPAVVVARTQGLLRQRFSAFAMPVPARDGGLGLDQLQAYPQDWDVWRLMVLFSRLVPGALRPTVPPRFEVPDARLLCLITAWMTSRRMVAADVALAPQLGEGWQRRKWVEAHDEAGRLLRRHQRDAVERMKARHLRGAPGHYLVMDTGHGKTLTALAYAMWRLLCTDLGDRVRRIIWITPPGAKMDKKGKADDPRNFQLIRSLLDEFEGDDALVRVPVSFVSKKNPNFPEFTLCIAHHDHIRSIPDALFDVAATSFVVFDEGDNFYGPSLRTSAALRLAGLCPEFVIQTATPVPGRGKIERLADWLGLTEEYPVTKTNYLVAACNMVALRVSLGIESKYLTHEVPRSQPAIAAFDSYIRSKDWATLFRTLQREVDGAFCDRAAYHARRDRADTPTGGCFVVCDNSAHVDRLVEQFAERHPDLRCGDANGMDDPKVAVVFVRASNNRGYNTGVRLGVQIRQPYPGSGASRQQMEGRIRRLTQRREKVTYEVVYMRDTLMQLLHERQQRDDSVNHSLEQLAEEYDRSVLESSTGDGVGTA